MAFPNSGFVEFMPDTVQILSGFFSFANDPTPQAGRPVGDLQTYYDARTPDYVAGPCLSRDTENPAASGNYVPAVGQYKLQFSASSRRVRFYDTTFPGPIAAEIDLNSADFPMGMELNQASVAVNSKTLFAQGRQRNLLQIDMDYFGSNFYDYLPPFTPVMLTGTVASPPTGPNAIIPSFFTSWSPVRFMKPFGVTINVNADANVSANNVSSVLAGVSIYAVYNTQLFRMNQPGLADGEASALPGDICTLENPQQRLENFDPEQFQIYWDDPTSTDPDFPGMTGVYIPRRNIITFTSSILRFRMPVGLGIPYGGRRLMLVGASNSTFFVGKYALQNYNIMLVNGSGLYRLTPNKRNDTYYDRSVTPVETIDLAIPQPRAKSGFFNG